MPRTYLVAIAAVALLTAAWVAGASLLKGARAPLVESPEAVAAGQAVYAYRCHGCHRDVPLAKRVTGWSADRAYDFIGVQQDFPRALMPRFPGSDEERRALAIWIQALGAGKVEQR